jgi:hypothetical protein
MSQGESFLLHQSCENSFSQGGVGNPHPPSSDTVLPVSGNNGDSVAVNSNTVGAKIIARPLKNAYVSKMFVTFLF